MTNRTGAAAMLVLIGMPLYAHRLDEYLQATIISLERNSLHAEMRLTPGVAVLPEVLASIDTNADGAISAAEQRAYAEQMVRDLSFTIDGRPLKLRLVSVGFPAMGEIREGRGEIQLVLNADLPRAGPNRRLIFENHHDNRIGVYLVNCLVPTDPAVRIMGQTRNYSQSFYQLDFVDTKARWAAQPIGTVAFLGLAGIALLWRNNKRRRASRKRSNVEEDRFAGTAQVQVEVPCAGRRCWTSEECWPAIFRRQRKNPI
jgi:hypothetical protein